MREGGTDKGEENRTGLGAVHARRGLGVLVLPPGPIIRVSHRTHTAPAPTFPSSRAATASKWRIFSGGAAGGDAIMGKAVDRPQT